MRRLVWTALAATAVTSAQPSDALKIAPLVENVNHRDHESDSTGLKIRDTTLTVVWQGLTLPFTAFEFRWQKLILVRLAREFSCTELLDHVHGDLHDVSDRTIHSHIKNIRRKLDATQMQGHSIPSGYGVGYRYERLLAHGIAF